MIGTLIVCGISIVVGFATGSMTQAKHDVKDLKSASYKTRDEFDEFYKKFKQIKNKEDREELLKMFFDNVQEMYSASTYKEKKAAQKSFKDMHDKINEDYLNPSSNRNVLRKSIELSALLENSLDDPSVKFAINKIMKELYGIGVGA